MCDGLRCLEAAESRLYHFGLKNVVRSIVVDANNSRPVNFFKDLFAEMYALCAAKVPKHKFRFKSKLFSPDATTITLCLSLFPWAAFRQAKGVFFMIRLKKNAATKFVERLSGNRRSGVTSDHIIEVTHKKKTPRLRRVRYRGPESGKRYEFFPNHFRLRVQIIAGIYCERWPIELFFKEIKQNLHITALTVYLLLKYQKFISSLGLSVQQLFSNQSARECLPGRTPQFTTTKNRKSL